MAGNDTFNDTVTTSNDTYRWGLGSGLDTLTDAGGSLDQLDVAAFSGAGDLDEHATTLTEVSSSVVSG